MKEILNLQSEQVIRQKLEDIGLNLDEYSKAKTALANFDIKTLLELASLSEVRINNIKNCSLNISTKELYTDENGKYTRERLEFHNEIVRNKLKGLFSVSDPELLFIVGPTGAGKTTLRNQLLQEDPNYVYTGLDDLRKEVLPIFEQSNPDHISRTQAEVSDIATKILEAAKQTRMNVITESTLKKPDWIENTLLDIKDYKTSMILIHTPLDLCFRRTIELRDRPSSLNFIIGSFSSYGNFFKMLEKNEINKFGIVDGSTSLNFDTILKMGDGDVFINDKKMYALEKYLRNFSGLNEKKGDIFLPTS